MKILFLHSSNTGAIGYYRSRIPARALAAAGHEVTWQDDSSWQTWMKPTAEKWLVKHLDEFDFLVIDRAIIWEHLGLFAGFREKSADCRMVVDFDDDFLDVPRWNLASKRYRAGQQFRQVSLAHLRLAEMTTVSTQTLVDKFTPRAQRVRLAPNFIDPADWANLPVDPERADDPHLRILYGGAGGHFTDLDMIRPGLEAVLRNPPCPIRFVCFGALPLWLHKIEYEFPGRIVNLPWADLADYPQAVAWGGFDLALAPLAEHPFNAAKSNIKWLEAGIQGIPLLCSKVGPYASIPDGAALRLANTPQDWEEGLRTALTDSALRESLRETACEAVMASWTIDKAAPTWQSILEETATCPRILSLEDAGLAPAPDPAWSPGEAPQADCPAVEAL